MSSNSQTKKHFTFLKPIAIVSLILVLIAGIVIGIWGFNAGFDFTGGTQLVVEFGGLSNINTDEDKDYDKAAQDIRQILKKHNVKINSFQTQGEYNSRSFVITFKNVSNKDLQDLRIEINNKYNASDAFASIKNTENAYQIIGENTDLTRRTSKIDSFIVRNSYLATVSSLLFVVSVLAFYACFRVKGSGAISILVCGVFDVIMTLALLAISRIEINAYLFALLALLLGMSIYASASFFFDIKELAKQPKYSEKENYELAIAVLQQNWKKNLIVYISLAVIALVIGFLGVPTIIHLGLAAFAGVAVIFASHIFVLPAFWNLICKNKVSYVVGAMAQNKKSANKENPKQIVEEDDEEEDDLEEESEEEVVEESSENPTDENSEEVEVEIEEEDKN